MFRVTDFLPPLPSCCKKVLERDQRKQKTVLVQV